MRKIIPSPTAFTSFTGSIDYVDNSDADLSRSLAENVDLPAIFRTLDQGVCPGLILSTDDGGVLICSGSSVVMLADVIVITFAPIRLLDVCVTVNLSPSDPGGVAVRIPGTEWYLEVFTQSVA